MRSNAADVAFEVRDISFFIAFAILGRKGMVDRGPGNAFYHKQADARIERVDRWHRSEGEITDRDVACSPPASDGDYLAIRKPLPMISR